VRRPILNVHFDQSSSIAIIPDMTWTGLMPLAVAVAHHVTTTTRLKRGEWFVNTDPDNSGGHLFFRGRKAILTFTVEGKRG
jgi:hypothetical protein